jgi:hypothetical protein
MSFERSMGDKSWDISKMKGLAIKLDGLSLSLVNRPEISASRVMYGFFLSFAFRWNSKKQKTKTPQKNQKPKKRVSGEVLMRLTTA